MNKYLSNFPIIFTSCTAGIVWYCVKKEPETKKIEFSRLMKNKELDTNIKFTRVMEDLIEKLEPETKKIEFTRLMRKLDDERVNIKGHSHSFRRMTDKYANLGLMKLPQVSEDEFVKLCGENLSASESEDALKLFYDYYGGIITKICRVGYNPFGQRPIIALSSQDCKSCFDVKTMTYMTASRIAVLNNSGMEQENFERHVAGYLDNYRRFCDSFVKDEPKCEGLYINDPFDNIVKRISENRYVNGKDTKK